MRRSAASCGIAALAALLAMAPAATAERPQGWDTSHWEGTHEQADWDEAYAGGFVFCYTKATDGTWFIDWTMDDNMTKGAAAGMYMGVFHFCHPQTYSANAEADYFVTHAGQYMTAGWLRPCLDLEDGYTLGATSLSNWVNAFINRVETLTGVECIVYTNTNYATHYLNSTVANRDLWIAQYLYDPDPQHDTPSIGVFNRWWFWQWTDAGYVPGFGLKDSDVFNGTMLQLYGFVIGGGAEPPSILDQPASMSVPLGGTATFIVSAGGTDPLGYRWQKNGSNLNDGGHYSGCTTTTLHVSNVDNNDVANYRCVVTNSYGSATSNEAALTIGEAPTIHIVESRSGGLNYYTHYSETGTWNDGSSKSTAAGCTAGIGHRWCAIGSVVPAPTATYRFRPVVGATYEIFTTNVNTDNSGNPLMHIVTHAGGTANVGVCQNSSCGNNPINKWRSLGQYALNAGTEYSVVQNASTSVGSAPANNAGRADAIKWERIGGGSDPPTITEHPANQVVALGETAYLSVAASGTGPLEYRWQKNQSNLSDGGHYSGTTSATLTISNADDNDEADYRCVVSNNYGTATSDAATVTVTMCVAPGLLNGDFEGGNTNGVGTSWTGYQRATNPTTVWSIQTASPPTGGGLQYQQIANTSATGGGGVRQNVTQTSSGAVYTIAGWMRTNSATATCTVKCSPSASADWATALDLSPAQATTSNSWVPFSGTITATGTSMTLWLDGHTGGSGVNKAACFDSVTVTGCGVPSGPTITQHPTSKTVASGATTTLGVVATGGGTLTYEWQKNQVALANGGHYAGCATDTLTVSNCNASDAASYRCVVTADGGTATSNAALLLVGQPGDFDQDSDADQSDFGLFQRCLGIANAAGDPTCDIADLDNDNAVDSNDVSLFGGCFSGANVPGDPACLGE